MAVGEITDRAQIGDRAIHGKNPVGGDQPETRGLRLLQTRLEFVHVAVGITKALRLAEADAVDDRGVVERVGNDRVLLTEDGLEKAAVRIETRGIQNRVLGTKKFTEARLKFLVDALGAADEAHRGQSVSPTVERLVRGGDEFGVIGKAEIVVRAEVDHIGAGTGPDVGGLRCRDHALGLAESGGLQGFELRGEMVLITNVHDSGELPFQNDFARLPALHDREAPLELGVMEAVRDDGADVETALKHHRHLVPCLIHPAAVDSRDGQHVENHGVPVDGDLPGRNS